MLCCAAGSWGDSGYFKLKIGAGGKEGLCGIATSASYPVKKSDNNPRVPLMCDPFGWSECPWGSSCSCSWWFPLFHLFCIKHDCCPLRHGVGCEDDQHCCPADTPVCNTQQGVCTSEDGSKIVPWTTKEPANYQNPASYEGAATGAAGGADDDESDDYYDGWMIDYVADSVHADDADQVPVVSQHKGAKISGSSSSSSQGWEDVAGSVAVE